MSRPGRRPPEPTRTARATRRRNREGAFGLIRRARDIDTRPRLRREDQTERDLVIHDRRPSRTEPTDRTHSERRRTTRVLVRTGQEEAGPSLALPDEARTDLFGTASTMPPARSRGAGRSGCRRVVGQLNGTGNQAGRGPDLPDEARAGRFLDRQHQVRLRDHVDIAVLVAATPVAGSAQVSV